MKGLTLVSTLVVTLSPLACRSTSKNGDTNEVKAFGERNRETKTEFLSWRNSSDNKRRMWNLSTLDVYEDKSADTSSFAEGRHYMVEMKVLSEGSFFDPENKKDYPLTFVKFQDVAEIVANVATVESYEGDTYTFRDYKGETFKAEAGKRIVIRTDGLPSAEPLFMYLAKSKSGAKIISVDPFKDTLCKGGGMKVSSGINSKGQRSAEVRVGGMQFSVGTAKSCTSEGDEFKCTFLTLRDEELYGSIVLKRDRTFKTTLVYASSEIAPESMDCEVSTPEDAVKRPFF